MSFKDNLLSFIIVVLIIQIGKIILKQTSFLNIYKSVSGIVIIITLLYIFSSIDMSIFNIDSDILYSKTSNNENIIIKDFQNSLQLKIKDDIHNTFYVNPIVSVHTDLNTLNIHLTGNFYSSASKIRDYIYDKYCNQGDEVTITNEFT